MKVYEITEIKKVMNSLLLGEAFDRFCLVTARISGAVSYTIDGRVNREFYKDPDDVPDGKNVSARSALSSGITGKGDPASSAFLATKGVISSLGKGSCDTDSVRTSISDYISWKEVKPHVLAVIKGKLLPLKFKIVLTLSPSDVVKVINRAGFSDQSDDIKALSFTISYDRDHAEYLESDESGLTGDNASGASATEDAGKVGTRQRMIFTTGFCRSSFTMDKSPEIYWDEAALDFIRRLENAD